MTAGYPLFDFQRVADTRFCGGGDDGLMSTGARQSGHELFASHHLDRHASYSVLAAAHRRARELVIRIEALKADAHSIARWTGRGNQALDFTTFCTTSRRRENALHVCHLSPYLSSLFQ